MKNTKKQKSKKTQTKKTAKPRAKRKPTKKQKLTAGEKKTYFLVVLGIFSACAFLLAVSFFIVPNISALISKRDVPRKEKVQTPVEPQPEPKAQTQPKVQAQSQKKQLEKQVQNKVQNSEVSSKAKTKPNKTKKVQPTTEKPQPKKTPKPAEPKLPKPTEPPKRQPPITPSKPQRSETVPSPPSKKAGVLVFVLDDAGHNFYQLEKFLNLPFKCTFAVLPGLPHSKAIAKKIRDTGHEVILHQPMQALDLNQDPGPKAVTGEMSPAEVQKLVAENLAELAPVKGINNHEGSLVTSREDLMKAVLELVKEKNLIFLDSRTNAKTVVPKVAKELGVIFFERNIFLDNSKKPVDMQKQLEEGMKYARENGQAILIGHVFTVELAELLKKMHKEILTQGFEIKTLSELSK